MYVYTYNMFTIVYYTLVLSLILVCGVLLLLPYFTVEDFDSVRL